MEAIVILVGLVVLNIAAWRWGVDSTDALDSLEWQRRRQWRGLGGRG